MDFSIAQYLLSNQGLETDGGNSDNDNIDFLDVDENYQKRLYTTSIC